FVVETTHTTLEDAGPQSVSGWVTGITAGPPDEAGQHLNFLVSNDHPELFAIQPSLALDGTLSYAPAANLNGSAIITVALHDDGGTANGGSDTSPAQTFRIVVLPVNDPPGFVAGKDQSVLEDSGPQTVIGWATGITAGPADEAGQHLNFVVSTDHPELFASQPSVAVDGTLSYTPAPNANGSATVTVALHDDGGTANGGSDTSVAQTFHIAVTAVNDAPSFVVGPDQTVLEDAGLRSVSGWATGISAGPADEAGQHLNFVVSTDHPELFASQPSVAVDGTLSYTPAPNANGSATVTVALHDDGGTANGGNDTSLAQTFHIVLAAVNDAPGFVAGTDQTVLEDSGLQTVTGWATAISAGPADEAGQQLNFVVSTDHPELFTSQPSVAVDGTLSYTPAPNANGSATVSVALHDDGGTAIGWEDTSVSQ